MLMAVVARVTTRHCPQGEVAHGTRRPAHGGSVRSLRVRRREQLANNADAGTAPAAATASVAITPSTDLIKIQGTESFTVTATMSDGTSKAVSGAWTSDAATSSPSTQPARPLAWDRDRL